VQALLQVDDLTVGYRSPDGRELRALDGLSLEIAAGEAVGLLGESGCGKTTLGLTLLGLLPAAGHVLRGAVVFRGENLLTLRESELQAMRGAAISMVHQEPGAALNPVRRVGDQVAEVIRAHKRVSRAFATEEAAFLLSQVGLPQNTGIAAAYPHQLSGGQQQRVAVAQAVACNPSLLIADEPTTALDRVTQLEILDLLARLRQRLRLALLLITHDSTVLARAVSRIMILQGGRIFEQGPTREVMRRSLHPYTQALLQTPAARRTNPSGPLAPEDPNLSAVCIPSHVDQTRRHQTRFADPVRAGSVGGNHHCGLDSLKVHSDSERTESETLLHTVNLQKRYTQGGRLSPRRHQVEALRGVDLKVRAGSTLALIGVSGSGKSTLARCLACLEKPDFGEIWFGGRNLAALSDRELIPLRRQIQMIFQDPGSSLNPWFTAAEIVSEPLLTVRYGTKKQCRDRALALMGQVGLRPDWADRLPHQFSAGQRRRLAIARAISLEPKLLILDEALTGLDRPIQAQIADLLLQLQATLRLAYLHISHDLGLVALLADRVAVLDRGQIVEAVNTAELLAKPQSVPASSLLGANATLELAASRSELE
jgi:peptide/nickel transport system ATP-binding protein